MARYQVCFLNHAKAIVAIETFEAEDDAFALAHARSAYRTGFGKGYELWQDERHFHTEWYDGSLEDHTMPLGRIGPNRDARG